jgi:hypothetical protein
MVLKNLTLQFSGVNKEKWARGIVVVEALRYKPKVAASIPDGVTGFFN